MEKPSKAGGAFLASLVAISVIATIFTGSLGVGIIVFAIAGIHLMVLGLPAFIVGWSTNSINSRSTLITGFLIGAIPTAILLWAWPEYSYSPKNLFENVRFSLVMGAFGLLGGLVFWLTWKYWVLPGNYSRNH